MGLAGMKGKKGYKRVFMKKKKVIAKKKATKIVNERRAHPRHDVKSLWATERSGDFEYRAQVLNISEGGIFLKNRVLSGDDLSTISLKSGKHQIQVSAQGIREEVSEKTFGVGYFFLNVSKDTSKQLRNLLGNLY